MASDTGTCWIIHGEKGVKPTRLEELHPLLFPPVLNRIFSHLSVWNHKKCRLVCKSWDAEIRPFLRLNCKVNLSKLVTSLSQEQNEQYCNYSTLLHGICKICTNFIIEEDPVIIPILIQQTTLPLHIKYLEIKNLKWNLSQITKVLKELPFLEELRLPIMCSISETNDDNCTSPPLISKKRVHQTNKYISKSSSLSNWKQPGENFSSCKKIAIFDEFLKLKKIIITLTIKDLQGFDYKFASVQPILKLIELAPNLEEIYYPNIVQFTSPFDNPARILLENIISSTILGKLSILKIDTFVRNTDLKILTAKKLPFKSLQLTVTPEIRCINLYEFLKCCENTLKSLTLTFRDGFKLTSQFPVLRGLETMAIILWKGHLDFIQDIAKLKILIVVLMEVEDEFLHKLKYHNFGALSHIEELEIHANQNSKAEMAQSCVCMMPQNTLRKLTLDWVNDTILQGIYKSLPNLEELAILYGGFSESGITGLASTFCREEYCDKEGYALELKKKQGISDLKKLQYLVLTGDLTDIIVVLGVCQCRHLKRLELMTRSNSTSSKLSDISIRKIADEMSSTLDFLRLKNFVGIMSDEMSTYLRIRFNGREIHLC